MFEIDNLTKNHFINNWHFNKIEMQYFTELILYAGEKTNATDLRLLFNKDTLGTYTVGDRKQSARYIYPDGQLGNYSEWVQQAIEKELFFIFGNGLNKQTTENNIRQIQKIVLETMEFRLESGEQLCNAIPNQLYTDIFRRLLLFILTGNPLTELATYKSTNSFLHKICIGLLNESQQQNISLHQRLIRSILAGLIGLNLKDDAAATSKIIGADILTINTNISVSENIKKTSQKLLDLLEKGISIDSFFEFENEIVSSNRQFKICFLTDDYAETIFDLDFIQALLIENPNLELELIPRRYRFGNDTSYKEVLDIISEPYFEQLRMLRDTNRFSISPWGPLLSAIDPRSMSFPMTKSIKNCDTLLVKGARAYEMLQGINKPAYYGFSVTREISESVTGINALSGEPVFIRQKSGEFTFENFTARAYRKIRFPDGRIIGLAEKTALEYFTGNKIIELS